MKNQLKIAEEISREVHKGQKRTIGRKEDYIEHPKRVASNFSTEASQITAWLHDTLEDSKFTSTDLHERGIDIESVREVVLLTRDKNEDYINYILRTKYNRHTRVIKIFDIKDNLIKLHNGSLRDKYLLALHILEN